MFAQWICISLSTVKPFISMFHHGDTVVVKLQQLAVAGRTTTQGLPQSPETTLKNRRNPTSPTDTTCQYLGLQQFSHATRFLWWTPATVPKFLHNFKAKMTNYFSQTMRILPQEKGLSLELVLKHWIWLTKLYHLSHQERKLLNLLLSMKKSWLFNKDPYIVVHYNLHITWVV